MSAPKPKLQADERLWEPLDRPGVFLTEAEVEAEEDAADAAFMDDWHRRNEAGELTTISLEEAIKQGWFTDEEAAILLGR